MKENLAEFADGKEVKAIPPNSLPNKWYNGLHNIENTCNSLYKAIDKEVYTYVCIWFLQDEKKVKYELVQRPNNSSKKQAQARIDWIRFALEHGSLKKGKYVIQCKFTRYTSGDGDLYGIVIDDSIVSTELKIINNPKSDINHTEEMISLEEHARVIAEMERWRAEAAVLKTQLDLERKYMAAGQQHLADSAGPKWADNLTKTLGDLATGAVPLLMQYLGQKNGPLPNNQPTFAPPMSAGPQDEISNYAAYFVSIANNEDKFWEELENLEKMNPTACAEVMKRLNVSWEE